MERRGRPLPRAERRKGGMLLQPVAWEQRGAPHHIEVVDAIEPDDFCGRNCAFQHAAKNNINLEHTTKVQAFHHFDRPPRAPVNDEQVVAHEVEQRGGPSVLEYQGEVQMHVEPLSELHHGYMLARHGTNDLERLTESKQTYHPVLHPAQFRPEHQCTNCGRDLV